MGGTRHPDPYWLVSGYGLLARSRHASVRSLERYARPGPEAVAHHLAETDPPRRRP